jgi:small basic protein
VNLFVTGPRAQAQVELKWKGVPRVGSATGVTARDAAQGLIAAATVAALQEYLEDDLALGVEHAEIAQIGGQAVAVVTLRLLSHRQCKTLVGCCTVDQDGQQAVALATLAALNRVVGGLRTKEPTEYVLRPTSA